MFWLIGRERSDAVLAVDEVLKGSSEEMIDGFAIRTFFYAFEG